MHVLTAGKVGTKIGDSSQEIAPAPLLIVNNGSRDMLGKYDYPHFSVTFICCLNELLTSSFPHSLDGRAYMGLVFSSFLHYLYTEKVPG